MMSRLRADLDEAISELHAHMASWEYAFAMGSSCHGAADHPAHRSTRERTEELRRRCHDLRARLAELDA